MMYMISHAPDDITHFAFLDESGDHSLIHIDDQFPVFVLAAIIIPINYYRSTINTQINQLKLKYWGHHDVVLHSRDIRKSKGLFDILLNPYTRAAFIADLNNIMSSLDYKVIAAAIKKDDLVDAYKYPYSPYDLTLEFIMERINMSFNGTHSRVKLLAESRDTKLDKELLQVYSQLTKHGNKYLSGPEFLQHIDGLEFIKKASNENGLQLADLVAHPIARKVIKPNQCNRAYPIVSSKFHSDHRGIVAGCGLKIFPESNY